MFQKMMVDHPRSVGESYFEHPAALSYAGPLFVAAFAANPRSCIKLCQNTGSTIIIRLYALADTRPWARCGDGRRLYTI